MMIRPLALLSLVSLAPACGSGDLGNNGGADADPTRPDADPTRPDGSIGPFPPTDYFPGDSIWYSDVSNADLDPESAEIIDWLAGAGGWGGGGVFRIDLSIEVLQADSSTPRLDFEPTGDWYDPDCDLGAIPVPNGGFLEGEDGYECVNDGDCHLIVVERDERRLYEMWRANIVDGTFYGGCLANWNLQTTYPPEGRGEQCTSADAAGYPIAPLLFNADEVAAGEINHAVRFILPNSRIREGVYVHPASHGTPATSAPAPAPMYGVRFRLRGDYPVDGLPAGARVIARALQRYGMFLADGGEIALTGQGDRTTTAKWDGVLDGYSLEALQVGDFEVVDGGERIPLTLDCVRNGL
jgi:serine/threonine-protein kinase